MTCQLPLLHARFALVAVSAGALAALAAAPTASATPPPYPNPLVEQRADPWIWKHHDGNYYFIATVPEYDRIELRRAQTISGLQQAKPKVIWRKHDRGPMSWHIWAPELHFIDGKWYIYFAAGRAEAIWDIRMYALENASPTPLEGEWIEKGQIKTPWESFSLDATSFEHRSRRYLVWAQRDPDIRGNSNLYIAELANPWTLKSPPTRLSRPEYPWEQVGFWVNEGPAILVRNGRVFLTYSASATDANYCLGLLTADADADLLDAESWTKSSAPVFVSSPPNRLYGPGHNCFTLAEDGVTDLLVYHARSYEAIDGDPLNNPDRHTRVQILKWKPDGTPDFRVPGADHAAEAILQRYGKIDIRVHDPSSIVKCRDAYWMFSTGRGVTAWRSPDRKDWRQIGRVFTDLPPWIHDVVPSQRGYFWAPDVIRHRDRYLLYYSVSKFGENTSAIALASNPTLDPDDPAFHWTDHGIVVRSNEQDDFNAIDPAVIATDSGELWMTFGSFWSGVKLVQLNPATGLRITPHSPLHSLACTDAIEAPHIHRHEGYYYLFVNWGNCCRGIHSTYNIRVGRSPNITGPYLDQQGVDLLQGGGTLLLDSNGPFIGPGHANILHQTNGFWFSCHFYDATDRGRPKLAILPLTWDQRGWPTLSLER